MYGDLVEFYGDLVEFYGDVYGICMVFFLEFYDDFDGWMMISWQLQSWMTMLRQCQARMNKPY